MEKIQQLFKIGYKTKTLVETAIYRVLKPHNFVQLAFNPSVLGYENVSY
jgi:hypothetical protein